MVREQRSSFSCRRLNLARQGYKHVGELLCFGNDYHLQPHSCHRHLDYPAQMAASSTFTKLKGRLSPSPFTRKFAWYSFVIASWVPAAIFFKDNVGAIGEVGGESMYPYLNPTFNQGFSKDLCWISKRQPATNLRRGMVVTFWYVPLLSSRTGSLLYSLQEPSSPRNPQHKARHSSTGRQSRYKSAIPLSNCRCAC